jgi:serine phosphatase RsbU (regulator of sigma subunit)/putative methionine-R-sulfoxide reductase with GAF domain
MSAADWSAILRLGEELLRLRSLPAQRDRIVATAEQLFQAQAELWLDEWLFRLPGIETDPAFSLAPPARAIAQALASGRLYHCREGEQVWAAAPLIAQGMLLGALQIGRAGGKPFRRRELDFLQGLAGHVALAIYTAHRLAVEEWRLEQLTLVRRVSAQLARLTDADELAQRVARLIQETFHYYYVALFTCEVGEPVLRLRSSAPAERGFPPTEPLRIRLGEGLIGLAAQTGQEILANDVSVEPRFRYVASLPETRAEVVLPLKIEERVLGVLDVQSDRLQAFHPNDLLVLRALADTIAIALEGTRLYSALEKRARQLALVAEVSDEITSILEPEKLLGRVTALIQERLGFPYVHLFTVHPNRRQIIYEAGSGARSERYASGYVLHLDRDEGIIPWVARHGQTVLANDVSREPRYRPSPLPPEDTRAELTVPLLYDNRVVGILDLQSDRLNAFAEEDVFLCEALADTIAIAIHNADLYRTERWRRRVAEGLREVAGLLSAEVGVDDVLDAILTELERNLPCDVSAIWLLDGEDLVLAQLHGAEAEAVEEALRFWPETKTYLASALQAVEPTIRRPTDPIGPSGAALGFPADYSSIAAALRIGDRPLGVLTLAHHEAGRYGHEAQAITATFASYAAVAIENARLYDATQEQAYASAALLQVAQTVATAATLEDVLAALARLTPLLVGVQACAIYLWEEGDFRLAQAYGFPEEVEALLPRTPGEGEFPLLDEARRQGQMVFGLLSPSSPADWLQPILPSTPEEARYWLTAGEHLLMAFPLLIKGAFYGAFLVEETAKARRFRHKRIEIITSIAQEAALSIQNEHLQRQMRDRARLEHELQLARRIQQTFLPQQLPELEGWELAAHWETAREVGGDFYDVIELPRQRLGLLIADVSDKGMPAALFMALTRTLVRAVVRETLSPAEVLRRVNNLIIPDNHQQMFVTAVYLLISAESGEVRYANAGHNPPLWIQAASGNIQPLPPTGMALGVVENARIEERTLPLRSGDVLLLYTDGLTEAFSAEGEMFGEARLRALLQHEAWHSAPALLQSIQNQVRAFVGDAPLTDDMTLLAARRLGRRRGRSAP